MKSEDKAVNSPENNTDQDLFDFGSLAEAMADDIAGALVEKSPGNRSVLNIRGAWGLGKSFFANKLTESLQAKEIKVVKLDTWLVNDTEGIFKLVCSELMGRDLNFCFRFLSIFNKIPQGLWLFIGFVFTSFLLVFCF